MEVALELEDDLFFADLSRQLSLLLMDDNEDPLPRPHVSLQALSHGVHYPTRPLATHEHAAAAVAAAYNGVSKGTGVFIPRSLQPARKQRRGRHNNIKPNRQFHISIDVNSQVSSNNHLMRPKKG
ncbi:hypothetical protein IC582_012723 [Cucumis melo]|uniref:Uncharacterized protein n=2 Tax=Cucumis melo TaxID=3656 RepID=A0A5D3D068_CUCMM|nr:uncharacterized protein LOC103483733 [Cucumis melo]KAA0049384.1 uncharacterized protein E6C27_scaffold171G006290 [Cucumis melo var. makuwa]TYK17175.1 uncharacterized protein E5676_scaffold434G00190 [Cucumis melo var. makuwa]